MASETNPTDASVEPFVHHATVSAWCRRLTDGRTMVIGFLNKPILPDGVNDAVVRVSMETSLIRNETETGKGQTFIDIVESGWKAIPSPNYISVSEALAMLG